MAQGSSNPQAGEPPQDQGDIESQLDTLLAEIKEGEVSPASAAAPVVAPPVASATVAEKSAAHAAPAAAPSDHAPAAFETKTESPAKSADVSGDELANQIQDLLDTAKASAAASAASSPDSTPATPAASHHSPAAPAAPVPAAAVAPAAPAPVKPVSPPAPAPPPAPAASKASLDHLDKELAANADNAVAGDFETVAEASGQSPDAEKDGASAGDSPADHAEEINEPALEGGFASPEELFEEKPAAAAKVAAAAGTDAKAVAKELDEQPERAAAKRPKDAAVASPSDGAPAPAPPQKRRALTATLLAILALVSFAAAVWFLKPWGKLSAETFTKTPWQTIAAAAVGIVAALAWLKFRRSRGASTAAASDGAVENNSSGSPLFNVMVAVNGPLLRLKPSTRNLVGWVGLLTLFNGSMLMMGRTVFNITGGATHSAVASESGHGEAGGHGEASAHGEAKKAEAGGHGESGGHGDSGHAKPKPKKAEAKKPGGKKVAKAEHGHEE